MEAEERTLVEVLPAEDRPRERLLRLGVRALSGTEILALLLGTGAHGASALDVASDLIRQFGSLRAVAEAEPLVLSQVAGVGSVKASRMKAAAEFGRRVVSHSAEPMPTIRSPEDVARLLMDEMRTLDREHFREILLNSKNRVLSVETISVGTLNASIVHPREGLKPAIMKSAAAIILVHNHPTGVPTPSQEDIAITRRFVKAGEIVGIDILDHVIIGNGQYQSLKELGVL
ncbi:MAG: DNA repair protein RadC [bacterium]